MREFFDTSNFPKGHSSGIEVGCNKIICRTEGKAVRVQDARGKRGETLQGC